jgi:hypothetical protein
LSALLRPRGTVIEIPPLCLMLFVDDTGHEEFADPRHPVFGFGGCAMMAAFVDREIRTPWQAMKAAHFGGADVPLHAATLAKPTATQLGALSNFFQGGRFQRFAAVIHNLAQLSPQIDPYQAVAGSLLKRFAEITRSWVPRPQEVLIVHEASERGEPLLERYFGKLTLRTDNGEIPVRQALMDKAVGEPALEVADFVVNAAGGQARRWARKKDGFQADFRAVFHVPEFLQSFMCIDAAVLGTPARPF